MSLSLILPAAVSSFLESLEVERNVSALTLRNYGLYLRRFTDWCQQHGREQIDQVNLDDVRQFRLFLARYVDEHGRTLSKKTQGYYIIALRSFLKWLIRQDVAVINPEKIELPKGESRTMKFLDGDQVERLLAQPLVSEPAGLRDKAILEVLFSTGLRVSELVSLNRDQVNTTTREFGVIGKGRRARVVFLSERAAHWLDRWLTTRLDRWQPVFIRFSRDQADITADGESMRLTTRSVQRLVAKYCRQAHLPVRISPHGLRHSFATDLLSHGAGLREVQEMLGHKNIATTQIYTHVTRPELKKVHQQYHGLASVANQVADESK